MSFIDIPVTKANRLINHGPTVLVTSGSKDKVNVMTAAWQMPVSFQPMLVAVAIGQTRFTHKLIEEGKEFVINVPHAGMMEEVWFCGTHSGKEIDKFALCHLTAIMGRKVKAPIIEQCIGNIECRLYKAYPAGDHTIFVGEVLAASVKEGLFDEHLRVDLDPARTIHHLGGRAFCRPSEVTTLGK